MLVLFLVRQVMLRWRTDQNQYRAEGVFGAGMESLQSRVTLLDARVSRLEREKAKLMSYCIKVLSHFSGCGNCKRNDSSRAELQAEFERLMVEVNQ